MNDKPVLLVDARNIMYRAIYSNRSNGTGRVPRHNFLVMLNIIHGIIERFKPCGVNIFWDAKRETVWRRRILAEYKARPSGNTKRAEIKEDLQATQEIGFEMFKYMGVRQFHKDGMEADDLIYAACRILYPSQIIIASSDSDYLQISYRMPNVRIYDPGYNRFLDVPDFDPVIQKALSKDTSDCIDGYDKIGPVNGARLAKSLSDLESFLNDRGRHPYIRNLLLIDLSLCPDLLKNILYVQKVLASEPGFDKGKLFDLAKSYKVSGFASEFSRVVLSFKTNKDTHEDADDCDRRA